MVPQALQRSRSSGPSRPQRGQCISLDIMIQNEWILETWRGECFAGAAASTYNRAR
jgi:hypothetical protein